MKIVVKQEFRDCNKFSLKYEVGSQHEFEDERAASLIQRGLVEKAETEPADAEADNETADAEAGTEPEIVDEASDNAEADNETADAKPKKVSRRKKQSE